MTLKLISHFILFDCCEPPPHPDSNSDLVDTPPGYQTTAFVLLSCLYAKTPPYIYIPYQGGGPGGEVLALRTGMCLLCEQ